MRKRKRRLKTLIGQKFGRLTILGIAEKTCGTRHGKFWVRCECGAEKTVCMSSFDRVKTCSKKCPFYSAGKITHGMTYDPVYRRTYRIWCGMKERCNSPQSKDWPRYGGRGISVCDRWVNDFQAFVGDMGIAPPEKSIDRKDNNGPYSPENCKWSTVVEQQNNRRSNTVVCFQGEKMNLNRAKKIIGINLMMRLKRKHGSWQKAIDHVPSDMD